MGRLPELVKEMLPSLPELLGNGIQWLGSFLEQIR